MMKHPDPADLRRAVLRHFQAHPKASTGAPLIIAVSGGPDSMALLDAMIHALADLRYRLVVAHLHHGIRGEAADRDQAFVAAAAHSRDLQFHTANVNVPAIAAREKLSLEDAARRARRSFLETVREKVGGAALALGHTKNDQAETLLLNLLRGAGPKGLGAMPEYGPGFITRPLIGITREEVMNYLEILGIEFQHDETNLDSGRTRNRVRHELLPLLGSQFNPNIVDTLARQADLFAEIDAWLGDEATAVLDRLVRRPAEADGPLRLDIGNLRTLPTALLREVLRLAFREQSGNLDGLSRDHIDALVDLVRRSEPGRLNLPGNVSAERAGNEVRLFIAGVHVEETDSVSAPIAVPRVAGAEVSWYGARLRVGLLTPGRISSAAVPPDGRRSAWFDLDQIAGELWLKPVSPGDRIRPYGMSGSRKISDVFVDRHVPAEFRTRRPALAVSRDGTAEVLWLPGLLRSNAALVTASCRSILVLDWFGRP